MPRLIDNLSDEKKTIALGLIARLREKQFEAIQFNRQLNTYKKQLASVKPELFLSLVLQIIPFQNEVYKLLSETLGIVDHEVLESIKDFFKQEPNSNAISSLLNYSNVINNLIVHTREKQSETSLFESLPEHKRALASTYIQEIRALKPFSDIIQEEVQRWKTRLQDITSIEALDEIDNELSILNTAIMETYNALITPLEDEEVNIALTTFLRANPHLLAQMKAFDFYESLTDDLLFRRGTLQMEIKPSK